MPRDDLPFAAGMAESADATDEMQGARSNALIIISPAAPYEAAKQFTLAWHSALDGALRLRRHREVFYGWTGTYYAEVSRERVDAEIYEFLSRCFMVGSKGELIPVRPNIGLVANVLKALKGWTFTNDDKSAPAWLGCIPDAEPSDILACANGLLHLPTRALMPHTPEFFCLNALPFGYDADAPPPIAWLKFLSSLWPDDQQSIDALQNYFGLCLSSETRYQKALAIIGPPRSGKGTIARTLTALVGKPNTCSLTFAQIAERFGLTGLVRARLAILADARLGPKVDKARVIERLLSMTGEDLMEIDRKIIPAWVGQPRARVALITDEMPELVDNSGALSARFIVLHAAISFLGREDLGLLDRLMLELPGILNWALDGWRRLSERGHFVQPESARDIIDEIEDAARPVATFVREKCKVGDPQFHSVKRADLYNAWRGWCTDQGRDHPGSAATFGKRLRVVVPSVTSRRPRKPGSPDINVDDRRQRYYYGVSLG